MPTTTLSEGDDDFRRMLDNVLGEDKVMHPEDDPDRPVGYGILNRTYEWRSFFGAPGTKDSVRAWCLSCAKFMELTLKVDPRYGQHESKHTRGDNSVMYNGKVVSAWQCVQCHQWIVK